MAIIFKTVRYKNLLSTGNEFTEINLNTNKTTLIVGKNGSGKSSVLCALSFGLYNKPFRNINKPQLINSINGKGLLVEVEFAVSNREYLVRRGMKPNIFEIYQDGKLLNQPSDNRDYQTTLEQNILRINYRSFRQIIVLGSANYVPFMQLPAYSRREVIEDLLDIQIFSVMNSILKNKIAANKEQITENQHQVELTNSMIDMQRKHLEELRQNNDELIEQKNNRIGLLRDEIADCFNQITEISNQLEVANASIPSSKWNKNYMEAQAIKNKIKDKISSAQKRITFYQGSSDCPTCKQSITEQFKNDSIQASEKVIATNNNNLKKLETKLKEIEEHLLEQKKYNELIQNLNNNITELNVKINSNNKFIEGFQKEIVGLEKKSKTITKNQTSDSDFTVKLVALSEEKKELLEARETLGVAASLLKDGGIKALIIKQYIPVMNKLINKYLHMMEFYVDFSLDENFKETILSRGRDDFSYDNFSQGEKMRIDLALLFAWRAIAKMRNSTSTNLLFFDVIFDSSLDSQGTDEFIKIIQNLTSDTNTFIISHKVDNIIDKFDTVIKFEKWKNFSRVAA